MLEEVYQSFVESNRWPTYEVLDHRADLQGVEDPLAVIQSLVPDLIQGLTQSEVPSLRQELSLTLEGVAEVARWNATARGDLDLFIRSLEVAVSVSDRTSPPNAARFDALKLLLSMYPHGAEVALLHRLHGLWDASAGHLWHSITGRGDPQWSADLNRQALRAYRRVHDVPGLVGAERQRRKAGRPPAAGAQPTSPAKTASPAGYGMPGWADLLPTPFKEALGTRLRDPGADAITGGWIELAELIHRKTGLELDNIALINQAFGKDAVVHLGPQETDSGRNRHLGYAELMRGLARMRNVHTHRGRPRELSELHVAALVLTMGDCYEQLAQLPDYEHGDLDS